MSFPSFVKKELIEAIFILSQRREFHVEIDVVASMSGLV